MKLFAFRKPLNVLTYLVRKNKRGNVAFEI